MSGGSEAMGILGGLSPARLLSALAAAWWTESRKAMSDLMMTQAVIAEDGTLAAWDGSLVSLIDIAGSASLSAAAERERRLDLLAERWNGLFTRPGHALHVVYENDPRGGEAELAGTLALLRAGARRYRLDLDDLIAERGRTVGALIGRECITLALWSRPCALDPAQYRHWRKSYAAMGALLPDPALAQNPYVASDDLITLHEAFVHAVLSALEEIGVAAGRLAAAAALDRIAAHLGPLLFGGAGHPRDTTAQARPRLRDVGTGSEALLGVPLAEQLLAFEPDSGRDTVTFAGRCYAPLDVALGPLRIAPYEDLVGRIRQAAVPVRLSLLFESAGLPGRGKSVPISALSLSALLGSASAALPFDATIDAGGSIKGYIATVRAALPPEARHLAGFFRLDNSAACAINIHDTRLGHRFPLPQKRPS